MYFKRGISKYSYVSCISTTPMIHCIVTHARMGHCPTNIQIFHPSGNANSHQILQSLLSQVFLAIVLNRVLHQKYNLLLRETKGLDKRTFSMPSESKYV